MGGYETNQFVKHNKTLILLRFNQNIQNLLKTKQLEKKTMGACQGQRKKTRVMKMTMSDLLQIIPPSDTSPRNKVQFFDSPELCWHLRTHQRSCYDTIRMLMANMEMSQEREACLEEVKVLSQKKNEALLRSYNENTDQAMKIMQKVQEYYQYHFLQYQQSNCDILLIKQIISDMTLQLSLESILIVNSLIDKNFKQEERWWSDEYYQQRINMILQSYPSQDQGTNIEQNPVPKFDPKDELVRPFLVFLSVLKSRISASIQLKASMALSMNGSTQIMQHQQNLFYQSLMNGLAFSIDPNEPSFQNKKNSVPVINTVQQNSQVLMK